MIQDLLTGKTAKEKAIIKSVEIAKLNFAGKYTNATYGIEVEILSVKDINGGIEIMARAWKGTQQLGFGPDGSVDIERFKIWNPPILHPDGTTREEIDIFGDISHPRNFKEDPIEATKSVLAYTISVVGKENGKIVNGKIGNTTSTFNPAAGANSPVDGRAYVDGTDDTTTFAIIHDTVTGTGADATATDNQAIVNLAARAATDAYNTLIRSFFLFDTSTIPDGDTISSATFSVYVLSVTNDLGGGHEVALVDTIPASNANIVVGDYTDGVESLTTKQATNLTIAGLTLSAFNNWTLNATGLANISKTGITKFGLRLEADRGNVAPTWVSGETAGIRGSYADGTSGDPKLVVEHAAAVAVVAQNNLLLMGVS